MTEQLYAERNQTGDITFLVESQQIRAHRIVLAALSPKYKAQFFGPQPDEGEIHVPNVSAAAFNQFLQLFYKHAVDFSIEYIATVLDLAVQSLVPEFVENCTEFLATIVNTKFCVAYRLAILYDLESLRVNCVDWIGKNAIRFFESNNFLQCDRDMLVSILKVDAFKCAETEVFQACIAWARAYCERNNLNAENSENLRTAFGDAIYQIRFSSINTEEFAALYQSVDGLLLADEIVEILYIIGKLKDYKPKKFNETPRTLYKKRKPKDQPRAHRRTIDEP